MADDLHKNRLKWVRRELDQVGAAVSLVGTRRTMLLKMAKYLEPSIEGLRGRRPEVRKLRENLERAHRNLIRGPTTSLRAGRNLRAARDLMDEVLKLQDKGLLDLPEEYEEGRFTLENAWGYTPDELRVFRGVLRQVVSDLSDVGLYRPLVYGAIVLDPEEAGGGFERDVQDDVFYADPSKGKSKTSFYEAFADRVWSKLFKASDRRTWDTRSRFVAAFTEAMRGRGSSEDRARLQVTVGKIAGDDWSNAAA